MFFRVFQKGSNTEEFRLKSPSVFKFHLGGGKGRGKLELSCITYKVTRLHNGCNVVILMEYFQMEEKFYIRMRTYLHNGG